MRGNGRAEVAEAMNEFQATDALCEKPVKLLRTMALQAWTFGFSCLLAVNRCGYLVPSSERSWNDICPIFCICVCLSVYYFSFDYLK